MKEANGYNPSKDPRLINCKTECGNYKCYAKRYGLFAEETCPNFVESKSITNADRIRAMSDEELADYLIRDVEAEAVRRSGRYLTAREIDRAINDCVSWLKSPVEVDNA